jgi:hypothetical protein
MDKICGNCTHYMGGGDWNLCCDIKHPTRWEKMVGVTYPFGHLCYENTPACDAFEPEDKNGNFSPDEQKTYVDMLERNSEKVGVNLSDLFG